MTTETTTPADVDAVALALRDALVDFYTTAHDRTGDVKKLAAVLGAKRDTVELLRLRLENTVQAAELARLDANMAEQLDVQARYEATTPRLQEAKAEAIRAFHDVWPTETDSSLAELVGQLRTQFAPRAALPIHAERAGLTQRMEDLKQARQHSPFPAHIAHAVVPGKQYSMAQLQAMNNGQVLHEIGEYVAATLAYEVQP